MPTWVPRGWRSGGTNTRSETVPIPRRRRQNRLQPAQPVSRPRRRRPLRQPLRQPLRHRHQGMPRQPPPPSHLWPPRRHLPLRLVRRLAPSRRSCRSLALTSSRSSSSDGRWWRSECACSSRDAGGCTHAGDIDIRRGRRRPSAILGPDRSAAGSPSSRPRRAGHGHRAGTFVSTTTCWSRVSSGTFGGIGGSGDGPLPL